MEKAPTHTTPVDWVGTEHLGFVVNAAFSTQNTEVITEWLKGLKAVTPQGLYPMSPEGLHITVLDWVAPLFAYTDEQGQPLDAQGRRRLFESMRPSYDAAFSRITSSIEPFNVHFTELKVTPGTIILIGQDNGQFQSLRGQFVDSVTRPPGTKNPPEIVHSSLARFIAPAIEMAPIEEYARAHPIDIVQRIDGFRLVETRREPMQDFEVLKTYPLNAA